MCWIYFHGLNLQFVNFITNYYTFVNNPLSNSYLISYANLLINFAKTLLNIHSRKRLKGERERDKEPLGKLNFQSKYKKYRKYKKRFWNCIDVEGKAISDKHWRLARPSINCSHCYNGLHTTSLFINYANEIVF